ncbi:prolyl oligopeptidase family serine peptidase [Streptomyces sp. NPDC059740]|uniref:prolyl oligopeptidase family serine peptidase n=1 Tax=Streptomyces sp. NPDC059740 TaxID=3346926 RepID=UPI00366639EA
MPTAAPYGTWASPIDAHLVATRDGRPEYLGTVGEEVWWTAPRPAEGGRRALVRLTAEGAEETVLPAPWDVRSRVIEYGGHPWAGAVTPDGPVVVFSHFADQRLHLFCPDSAEPPRPLTPLSDVGEGLRWADPVVLPERGEVWCVLEEFTGPSQADVRRVLAAVPLDGSAAGDRGRIRELSDDRNRFVTGPRLSPDGGRVAWIAWNHPAMPWDGTHALLADVTAEGTLAEVRTVAGGPREAVAQVEWAPDGGLLYASDPDGWWNLWYLAAGALAPGAPGAARQLGPKAAEEFAGGPLWRIGNRWFAPLPGGSIAVLHGLGDPVLGILDPVTGEVADVPGPWTTWANTLAVRDTRVVGLAGAADRSWEIVELDTRTGLTRAVAAHHTDDVDPAHYPKSFSRTFTGPGGREVHAHVHPPHHPDHTGPSGEAPPYVVWAHGGPTSRFPLVLDLEVAYFTSRGIGVVEVDYGGSTGYGRAYRERLRGMWGLVDVEDCAAVATALADEGTADPARLAIRGGSAGGWTTAASLAGTDVYACGVISYPVLDLLGWASGGTHDFESRYLETLVGPLADVPDRYRERSPLQHAEHVAVPFLLLQGLADVICPPVQCERFLAKVAGKGIPHAYLAFEGEGHGFRRESTLVRAVEAELALYAQTFGFVREDVPALELAR